MRYRTLVARVRLAHKMSINIITYASRWCLLDLINIHVILPSQQILNIMSYSQTQLDVTRAGQATRKK